MKSNCIWWYFVLKLLVSKGYLLLYSMYTKLVGIIGISPCGGIKIKFVWMVFSPHLMMSGGKTKIQKLIVS